MLRGGIGAPEILLILAVVVLLFGAKKLPDLARGSGRALRIFKSETKGLIDDKNTDDNNDDDKGEQDPASTSARSHELPSSETTRTDTTRGEATNHTSDKPR